MLLAINVKEKKQLNPKKLDRSLGIQLVLLVKRKSETSV
jgi:hypothetical protein